MPVTQENIRATIKELMFRDGIKQAEIVKLTGIHKGNLSKMINGVTTINPAVISFFEKKYQTNIEQLVAQLSGNSVKKDSEVSELRQAIAVMEVRISGLEKELARTEEVLRAKDEVIQELRSRLEEQSKKRESYHDNPGSSEPVRATDDVAGKK